MRILIISNLRPDKSGITEQVFNLTKKLKEEANDIILVSTYGTIFQRLKGLFFSFREANKSDLIIGVGCAFYGFLPIAIASIVAFFMSKPVFFNFHDGQAEVFLKKSEKLIRFFIREKKVVVASEYIYKIFQEYSFNTVLIPNFFDYGTFPSVKNEFKWNKKIIWARSFEKIYQPELALNVALKTLEKTDCEFHFYGNGSLYDELNNKFEHDKIVFHGLVSKELFLKDLSDSSIFLNTTIYDNMPNTFFESGYYKLLVVSTKVGGISTTFTENEVVFSPESSVNAFSDLLIKIVENPSAFDFYREKLNTKVLSYTWENVRNKWYSIIRTILN